jgi:hypothetical protein
MTEEAIIERLRELGGGAAATVVAGELSHISPEGLTQGTFVSYLKRAFPSIPLRTLLDASAWHRVSAGGMGDAALDELLAPWLPSRSG